MCIIMLKVIDPICKFNKLLSKKKKNAFAIHNLSVIIFGSTVRVWGNMLESVIRGLQQIIFIQCSVIGRGSQSVQ